METLSEELLRSDMDSQMTALVPEDFTEEHLGVGDEVEDLQNSLRQAVHDETIRPKMQCLMMDSSFSMVTMQGEDSGIEWETSPSRCTTPWLSEVGNPTLDFNSPATIRPTTPGSLPAGRIIIVMDDVQISRRKKTRKTNSGQKIKADQEPILEDSDEISKRPELVEVSLPNVKIEAEEDEEEVIDPVMDKDQRLFCLVSEGSEILNIVVPPKLSTVDEEESTVMVDNLSYLEESPVTKISEETNGAVFDPNYVVINSTQTPAGSQTTGGEQVRALQSIGLNITDPPGAPVATLPDRSATGNVDYFEKFTLIDAQAPGSPAFITVGEEEPQAEEATEIQYDENPEQLKGKSTLVKVGVDKITEDAIGEEEIASEILDEMFYGGTDDNLIKHSVDTEQCNLAESLPAKVSLKESGSALFSSQEDILTPIFLPEGPPKIIDPILLEEPKAMAFLYTDLYEEAMGSRKKDEDAESMTSEKSFHSRHSDREARGYLEKYVLIDETPVLELEPDDIEKSKRQEGVVRMLSQDSCDLADFLPVATKGEMADTEEEITDFFRSSANSSPCDKEPFPPTAEEENHVQSETKNRAKEKAKVTKTAQKVPKTDSIAENVENPIDQSSVASDDLFSEAPGWERMQDHPLSLDMKHDSVSTVQEIGKPALDIPKPVAPPRRKAASAPKSSLDITPLTPVETTEEGDNAGGKEQREEEEKEKASPAETADEGDGDGEETRQASLDVALSQDALLTEVAEAPDTEIVQGTDSNTETVDKGAKPAKTEGDEIVEEEKSEAKTAEKQSEVKLMDIKSAEMAQTEVKPEEQVDSVAELSKKGESECDLVSVPKKAKENSQCIIL